MSWTQTFTIAGGLSSAFGALGYLAALFFQNASKRDEQSVSQIIGSGPQRAKDVIEILKQFKDDASRLEALKALLHGQEEQARQLLEKLKSGIDIERLAKHANSHQHKILKLASLVALGFGVLVMVVAMVRTEPAPKPDPTQNESGYTTNLAADPQTLAWVDEPSGLVASGLKNKTGSGDLFIAVDDDYSGIFVLEINKDHIIKARAKLRLPVMNDSGTTEDLTTDLEGITRDENSGYYYAAASHRQLGTSKKALLARKLIEFRIDADTWNADTTIQHSRTLDLTDLGSGTPSLGEYLKVNGIIVDEKKWEVHDKDKTSGSEPLHPYALEIEGVAFAKGTLYLGLKWPLEGDTNAIMLAFDPAEKKFTGLYRLNLGRFGISELCYDKVADCLYVAANPPEHADTEAEYAEYFGKSQLYRFPLGRLAKREGVISGSKVAIKPSVNGKLEGIAIVGSNLILSFEGVSPSFSAVPLSEVRP